MIIFIIPSWYPSQKNPFSGIFVKEEIEALSLFYPSINFIESLNGFNDFDLAIKKPLDSLRSFINYFKSLGKCSIEKRSKNLYSIHNPCFNWSSRFFNGNIHGILKSHRINFLKSIEVLGKPDIIHAHVTFPAGWVAMKLSEEFGVPFIIKECMGPFPFNNKLLFDSKLNGLSGFMKEPLSAAKALLVQSPYLKSRLMDYGYSKIKILPYSIDDTHFKILEQPSTSTFNFFSLSSLSDEKGLPELLVAISLALKSNSDLFFTIGGVGESEKYKKQAIKLGIDHVIKWVGPISRVELPKFFAESHAFIMVSRLETFGMVYVEAIACGKPVVATRNGGAEFIVNSTNGILAEVGNSVGIAKAINDIVENYDRYRPNDIREDFMGRFSREKTVTSINSSYQLILNT